ncbi:amidohydrolase family protein [Luteibaculum oceani]|nr:amidohydrolase family protein [Luteibaculum oceani]
MKKILSFLGLGLSLFYSGFSQVAPVRGIADKDVEIKAYTNATVHVDANTTFKNATIVVKNGKIDAIGTQVAVPVNAVSVDLQGKHVYPSFVELYSAYGISEAPNKKGEYPVYESTNPGAYYWNDAIRPQMDAAGMFSPDQKSAEKWRKAGFGVSLSHHQDGIARGKGLAVTLGDGNTEENIIDLKNHAFFSFDKGSSSMSYPSSLMGSIALLRQAFYDAKWYSDAKPEKKNISLEHLSRQLNAPGFFKVSDKLDLLRAEKIAQEFGLSWIYVGGNDYYQNPDLFRNKNIKLVVPINHPKAYDVSNPLATSMLAMEDLKEYDWAPMNLYTLSKNGVRYALSASALEKPEEIFKEIRIALDAGANEKDILAALTTIPAQFAGIDKQVGSLERGKLANFLITNKPIFEKGSKIITNVVRGNGFEINPEPIADFAGKYLVQLGEKDFELSISEDKDSYKASLMSLLSDSTKHKVNVSTQGFGINLSFKLSDEEGYYRIQGRKSENGLKGRGSDPKGVPFNFSATSEEMEENENKNSEENENFPVSSFSYPMKAFGYPALPEKQSILIKNVTVWTNEKDGVLENTDVLISNGVIAQIGKNLPKANWTVIDGTGMHLTPGIVDEHSHIAISKGVNEGGQAVSAEVSIEHVVNPEDINIYRQLAGGVTAAQLLHGSANPIGGRSAVVKLKYGESPDEMLINNADGFIKFALGENVKQSNWGERFNSRYPQTRMGVEQMYYDAFHRALEYRKAKESARTAKDKPPYNIEYEVLLEILDRKRFVSCHSYIQSEINMLMHVADSLGFNINTFTHILEGYKVADKMKAHGVSGSTFSDWWAYKFEVKDAIPYNAAIMHEQGVNVGINSDDAEMGRRLNQEASKIVKYGGVSQVEAVKMVTLNPAKMLHIDNRVGSIRVGKDADVVLWSDVPLTQKAKVKYTLIEGKIYYSEDQEKAALERDQKQRVAIINKMMADKYGDKRKPTAAKREKMYHCESFNESSESHHD